MINLNKKLSFSGMLINKSREKCNVTVNVEYDQYGPQILNCRVASSYQDMVKFLNILGGRQLDPMITGEISKREKIYITYSGLIS